MFAARAACVRDFLASGAIGEVAVASRAPDGVKSLLQQKYVNSAHPECQLFIERAQLTVRKIHRAKWIEREAD